MIFIGKFVCLEKCNLVVPVREKCYLQSCSDNIRLHFELDSDNHSGSGLASLHVLPECLLAVQ